MALPKTIQVKLSTEAAGGISITPVVVQELPARELIEHVLGITGKDEGRIREILRRGTIVTSASRFRWAGWDVGSEGLSELLSTFPDPDPSLPFSAERCVRVLLRGGQRSVELLRNAVGKSRLWNLLTEAAGAGGAVYAGYSYRDRADRYLRTFSAAEAGRLRDAGGEVPFSALREQIRAATFSETELYVAREHFQESR